LLADYTRRGFCDGVGIRLPSIVVRPGKPNKAASGFFSGIIREPLAGLEAVLPVSETVVHTHASPRAAVGFLMHAAGLPRDALGPRINLSMPGVCCTVAEQIASLRRIDRRALHDGVKELMDRLGVRLDPEARAKAIEILARMIAQTLPTSTQPQNEVADE